MCLCCTYIGVELVDNPTIVSDNILSENFLFAAVTTDTILARCVTGLGPSGNQGNTILGEWAFNGTPIPYGECNMNNLAIQPRGATDVAGVIDLYQCETFTTAAEGIYACTVMNSSMMDQAMSVGVYFPGRSKSLICILLNLCLYM